MKEKTLDEWRAERTALLACLSEFSAVLRRRPFNNEGGLRGVSAFALYWYLKQIRPTLVLEVGVWRGFSTWLIEQAVPRAEVVCFDPVIFLQHLLSRWKVGRVYRSDRAKYLRDEFSCAEIAPLIASHERPCVFFDDHQNKLPRLQQARALGIKHVIFDDNVSYPSTHRTLEDYKRDPTAAALLDSLVSDYEVFPALWEFTMRVDDRVLHEDGLDFPIKKEFAEVYAERGWHSCVTHVLLR